MPRPAACSKERDVARIFKNHGLRLEIELSEGRVGKMKKFPYLKASSWLQVLDKQGCLGNLLGLGLECRTLEEARPSLLQFWDKYRTTHGSHEVYALASRGDLDLGQSIPVYIHGDEGTTYKKDGALVASFFCPIGQGVAGAKSGEDPAELHMNFVGHGFATRFVMATLMKAGWVNSKWSEDVVYANLYV